MALQGVSNYRLCVISQMCHTFCRPSYHVCHTSAFGECATLRISSILRNENRFGSKLVQRRRIRDSTVFQNYLYTFDALRIGGHSFKTIMISYMHLVLCMPLAVSMCVARTSSSHRLKFNLLLEELSQGAHGIANRKLTVCS